MSGPKMPSNTALFAKRGDPWITDRTRQNDYSFSEHENPDLDRYTRAKQAKERHERKDNKPGVLDGDHRKRVNAILVMKRKMKGGT